MNTPLAKRRPCRGWWLALLLLGGCGGEPPDLARSTTQLLMDTTVTITTWNLSQELDTRAVAAAFAEFHRIDQLMSSYNPATPVARINQAPRDTWQPLDQETALVVQRGLEISRLSAGAFDLGLMPLSQLWNITGDPPPTDPPSPATLTGFCVRRQGGENITLRSTPTGYEIKLRNAATGLDLGGIAKGYAIDRGIAALQQAGVTNAVINAGGDLRMIGSKSGAPWRIGIQHPRDTSRVIAVAEFTQDRSMVTSGDYERYFMHSQVRYHHIFDPVTCAPARSGLVSVSIQAPDALTADALSTALFVLGETAGLKLLGHFPEAAAAVIREHGLEHLQSDGFTAIW